MTKQKVGSALFWIAVIWAVAWGIVGSVLVDTAFRTSTMEELDQSMWAESGPWFFLWGFGFPIGAVIALIGILLFSGAKGTTAGIYAVGVFLGLVVSMAFSFLGHIPPLFGVGGTLILLFFIGILKYWAKERSVLEDKSTAAADFRLAGYTFMVIAAWFTCGIASQPFLKAFEGEKPGTPIHVMVLFVLGWFFVFLSHHTANKQAGSG